MTEPITRVQPALFSCKVCNNEFWHHGVSTRTWIAPGRL